MKYIVKESYIDVVGKLWMPMRPASLRINVRDVEDLRDEDGKITRDSIDDWLTTHSVDFSSIIDWSASIEDGDKTVDFPFATEEGEMQYLATFPEEY